MKKLLLALLLTGLMATNVFAAAQLTNFTTLFTNEAMATGTAEESAGVFVRNSIGFATLIVTEDASGGAGDVDIYAEYSVDNSTWARAYTSNMSGTITQEGNIVTTLGNVTRHIIFTPRLSNWIRIVFDPDATSEITATLTFLEDR